MSADKEPSSSDGSYGLSSVASDREVSAPALAYRPEWPQDESPPIGLIGAGGISEHHLRAYRSMGLNVEAICDRDKSRAEARRDEFFPNAQVFQDYRQLLALDSIGVADITTHPEERVPIITDALNAGKHVLSQKPFVTDLDVGEELVALADKNGVKLAVNQNGRWAPHFRYITRCIRENVLGPLSSIDFSLQWDHTWTAGTPFEQIHHLILYDFGIHWFDMIRVLVGARGAAANLRDDDARRVPRDGATVSGPGCDRVPGRSSAYELQCACDVGAGGPHGRRGSRWHDSLRRRKLE